MRVITVHVSRVIQVRHGGLIQLSGKNLFLWPKDGIASLVISVHHSVRADTT